MELISVDKELCRRDGICMEACPARCITADAEGYPQVQNPDHCFACGHCVAICPFGALNNARAPMAECIPMPRERAGLAAATGLMKGRRSVREYKAEPVPRATLETLLDAARFAPTAVNTQQVGYLVTLDPARTRALAGGVAQWMRGNLHVRPYFKSFVDDWEQGHDRILRGAPHVVVALCDAKNDWALTDAAIALSYLELAAAAAGLGVCWAGILHRALAGDAQLAASVGIPEGRVCSGALMLGAPKYKYPLVPPRNAAQVSWL